MLLEQEGRKLSLSDQIEALAEQVSSEVANAVSNIEDMDNATRMVALNAKIEAACAGEVGQAFSVVANEIKRLSKATAHIAVNIKEETQRSSYLVRQRMENCFERGTVFLY